jgi:hypothetical protein
MDSSIRKVLGGVAAGFSLYARPPFLHVTYGEHPVPFHVFVRIARRPDERMWNMTIGTLNVRGGRVI